MKYPIHSWKLALQLKKYIQIRKNNYLEIDYTTITNICEIIKKNTEMLRLLVGTFQLIMNLIA